MATDTGTKVLCKMRHKIQGKLHNNNSLFSPFIGRTSQVKSTLVSVNNISIYTKNQDTN